MAENLGPNNSNLEGGEVLEQREKGQEGAQEKYERRINKLAELFKEFFSPEIYKNFEMHMPDISQVAEEDNKTFITSVIEMMEKKKEALKNNPEGFREVLPATYQEVYEALERKYYKIIADYEEDFLKEKMNEIKQI